MKKRKDGRYMIRVISVLMKTSEKNSKQFTANQKRKLSRKNPKFG